MGLRKLDDGIQWEVPLPEFKVRYPGQEAAHRRFGDPPSELIADAEVLAKAEPWIAVRAPVEIVPCW